MVSTDPASIDLDYGFYVSLTGEVQSVPRAELVAVLKVALCIEGGIAIFTDTRAVHKGCNGRHIRSPDGANGDLWLQFKVATANRRG